MIEIPTFSTLQYSAERTVTRVYFLKLCLKIISKQFRFRLKRRHDNIVEQIQKSQFFYAHPFAI
jgi:hypothetical protein